MILQQQLDQLPTLPGQTFLQLGVGLPAGIRDRRPRHDLLENPPATAQTPPPAHPRTLTSGSLLQLWIFVDVDDATYEKEPSNPHNDTTIPIRRLRPGRPPPCQEATPDL